MLLAIDTSTAQMGLALYDGGQVLAEWIWRGRVHHSRELAPMLVHLLDRCGIGIEVLQVIGVAIGPGSFTSLRVGLALAKGLALSRQLALIGVPTLEVVAAAMPVAEGRLAAVLQAGRGRLAVGWYRSGWAGWEAEGPSTITTLGQLLDSLHESTFICGELTANEREECGKHPLVRLASPAQCVRRPAFLAELAWARWQWGQLDSVATLSPIYLHVYGGPT